MTSELPTLAVTGSTGALGVRVAQRLASSDLDQRLLARDVARAPRVDGGVPVGFDGYADRASAVRALEGVSTLFMVSASESTNRLEEHRAFVDAAASAGVRHVVYTSFHGAAPDCTFTLGRDHFSTEEHIRESGMDWTFLRNNFYLDILPELVGEDGVLRGPAGGGQVAAVAREDVAACAAAVLAEPGAHVHSTYQLTGSESLTLTTVAERISAVLERDVSYHDETVSEAYESRKRWPAPDWQYDAWVSTYTAIANGELAERTNLVLTLTGRPPLTLEDLLGRR